MTDTLFAGQSLVAGDSPSPRSLTSDNEQYSVIMQDDGNLVMYPLPGGSAIWATNTGGLGAHRADMQDDGTLVLYHPDGSAVWAAGGSGQGPGSRLVMQDDRNLVVYNQNDELTWASDTGIADSLTA